MAWTCRNCGASNSEDRCRYCRSYREHEVSDMPEPRWRVGKSGTVEENPWFDGYSLRPVKVTAPGPLAMIKL